MFESGAKLLVKLVSFATWCCIDVCVIQQLTWHITREISIVKAFLNMYLAGTKSKFITYFWLIWCPGEVFWEGSFFSVSFFSLSRVLQYRPIVFEFLYFHIFYFRAFPFDRRIYSMQSIIKMYHQNKGMSLHLFFLD